MAKNNVKCRGYDTLQTREEDYCGYCKQIAIQTNCLGFSWVSLLTAYYFSPGNSEVNPLAASFKLRKELLAVGPYCVGEDNTVHYCSPNASRTQRSGVVDIEYMNRPDRRYWSLVVESNHAHTHAHAHAHATNHQIRTSWQRKQVCTRPARARGGLRH